MKLYMRWKVCLPRRYAMAYWSYNQYRTYMRWKVCLPRRYAMTYWSYNRILHICDGKYVVQGCMRWHIGHTLIDEHICDGMYPMKILFILRTRLLLEIMRTLYFVREVTLWAVYERWKFLRFRQKRDVIGQWQLAKFIWIAVLWQIQLNMSIMIRMVASDSVSNFDIYMNTKGLEKFLLKNNR